MKGFWAVTLGIAGVLVFGGAVLLGMLIATDPGDNVRLVESGFELHQDGSRFVTGTIRNHTDNLYLHLQVEIEFLDEEGGVVGGTVVTTANLSGGGTWFLEAPVQGEAAVQARVFNLSCRKTEEEPHPRACYILPTLISLVEEGGG